MFNVDVTTQLNSVEHIELSYEVAVVVHKPQLVNDSLIGCVPAPDRADNKCIGLHTVPRLNVVLGKLGVLSLLIVLSCLKDSISIFEWHSDIYELACHVTRDKIQSGGLIQTVDHLIDSDGDNGSMKRPQQPVLNSTLSPHDGSKFRPPEVQGVEHDLF
jgi:hypothetical protein